MLGEIEAPYLDSARCNQQVAVTCLQSLATPSQMRPTGSESRVLQGFSQKRTCDTWLGSGGGTRCAEQRVIWVTHGSITLFLKDATNTNLSTGDFQVSGSAGQFIGIQRATADVRGVTIGFPEAFTIDDFTYSGRAPIPEPSSSVLIAMGLTALLGWRRVRSSQVRQR